jgi:hypothetical protein
MDTAKKACCARAAGWSLVGITIALSWGIGNLANGMSPLRAFAIPALICIAVVGAVALAALNVPWFNRLCACPATNPRNEPHEGRDTVTG